MKLLKYIFISICGICLLLLLSCSSDHAADNNSTLASKTLNIESKIISPDIAQSSSEPENHSDNNLENKSENNSINESSTDPSDKQQETTKHELPEQHEEDVVQTEIDLRKLADYKYIAITFDDGPIPGNEEKLLELFSQYKGHATFFYNGFKIERCPEILNKVLEQGSELGNHTYNHCNLNTVNAEQTMAEVEDLNDLIENITGTVPVFVRPPFGEYNQLTLDTLPYPLVMWSQDTRDWETLDVDCIRDKILDVSPGSIILCHSPINETILAVEQALPILYEQGYRFVTLSNLFEIYEVEPKAHQVFWHLSTPFTD
ncbi:MAG TPA: polysaccharide deacetylase family protein [Clostridiaceae bacterium]|nr:polysaccharide deacetylase family protein [Clostridiaceae bacterium]